MKPPPFEYVAPAGLDEALDALASGGEDARVLAGGQSLIPMLNFRLAGSRLLVDLNGVAELAGVHALGDGSLEIGAMTRQRVLERDPLIAERAPLLAEGAPWIAHPQIRNRGTVGGSLAHADPAAELPALLLTLGASVRVARARREGEEPGRIERSIPLGELYFGPFFTALEPDEVITAVRVPPRASREGTAFDEFARRRGDYAIAGTACRVRLEPDGTCAEAAVALVNAGPAPALVEGAAEALQGNVPDGPVLDAAADAAAAECQPAADMHGSVAYRRHLVRVLVRRTLERAVRRAEDAQRPAGSPVEEPE